MHRELTLYVFVRNSIMLCLAFFAISSIIIERGRLERGENSLFNYFHNKKIGFRDYNNFNLSKSQESNPIFEDSNFSTSIDSISKTNANRYFIGVLVDNKYQSFTALNRVDL